MKTCRAYFDDYNQIIVLYHKSFYNGKIKELYIVDEDKRIPLTFEKVNETDEWVTYNATIPFNIQVGKKYEIYESYGSKYEIQYRFITKTKKFDDEFYTELELGSIYSKKATTFRVWSPFALDAHVKLDGIMYPLKRRENGVFENIIKGDHDGKEYTYVLRLNGNYIETIDPYGKLTSFNSKSSVVYNPKKTEINWVKYEINKNTSLYETNFHDVSAFLNSKNAGKYLGVLEPIYNYPTILDYIKSLNISHIQWMPIHDFGSVSDDYKDDYNWGYDPIHYFSLEGSYSSSPKDPYARVKEFKQVVNECHKRNLGVTVDTVYNHVYDTESNPLNLTVPYYYFRYEHRNLTNFSGCRNDTDDERRMFKKFMKDSILHLFKEFNVDGIRFDLMGLIDLKTIEEARLEALKINPNTIFYGEAWNMRIGDNLANFRNIKSYDKIGAFNDYFRDNIIGSPFDKKDVGILSHNEGKLYFAEDVMNGNHGGDFSTCLQSVNYIECHDGYSAYDYVQNNKKKAVLGLVYVALSKGIPFIQCGQEILRTKNGEHNSYISKIDVNGIRFEENKIHLDAKETFAYFMKLRNECYDEKTFIKIHRVSQGIIVDIFAKKHLSLYVAWEDNWTISEHNCLYSSSRSTTLNKDDFALIEK